MREEYLTEILLGDFLKERFNSNFLHDRKLTNSNIRGRYDYIFENEKLIVEFDGYRHYNCSKQILSDYNKNKIAENLGYKLIRLPYFLQLDEEVIGFYFDKYISNQNKFNNYPHGFIDKNAMLPADYCELGQIEFINFLNKTKNTKFNKDIINNLKELIRIKDKRLVMFKTLEELIF